MTNDTSFGSQLKAIRTSMNWSQLQLAESTELSVEAISNLERGLNKPSYATMEKLATALKVPMRYFFEFDDQNPVRSQALAALLAHARQMSDSDLERAVSIMKTLAHGA